MWYGLHLGLSRAEALTIPFCLLLDLIAVEQIKLEGAKRQPSEEEETAAFLQLLTWR